jgi:hypothetical protein
MTEVASKRPGGEYLRTTNLMYAMYTFADMARKRGIKTIITGTHYSTFRALVLGSSTHRGPSRDRARCAIFPDKKFSWPLSASADKYRGFILNFFGVQVFEVTKLEYLAYRPENFFVVFLAQVRPTADCYLYID